MLEISLVNERKRIYNKLLLKMH